MWHVPSANNLFIIMGIPATIELLKSLRSSFQLTAIKYRIKTTTKKPKGNKFYSKCFYENTKTNV